MSDYPSSFGTGSPAKAVCRFTAGHSRRRAAIAASRTAFRFTDCHNCTIFSGGLSWGGLSAESMTTCTEELAAVRGREPTSLFAVTALTPDGRAGSSPSEDF